jgi:calcineurin-like phosphoesterase family protein
MTGGIIDNINENAGYNDDIICLGDFCLDTTVSQLEELLSRITCQNIWVLWGNHNAALKEVYALEVLKKYNDPEIEVYPTRYRNLIFVGNYLECKVNKQKIVACHYPIISWNKMRHNVWMLHGHCHGNLNPPVNGKALDISWDTYKSVLSFDELEKIMYKKPVMGDGGHH